MGKKTGRKAQLSGDFEYPVPPINVVATDVGTDRPYNNGAISITFEYPSGQLPIINYTAKFTPNTGSTTYTDFAATSPIVISGIPSGLTGFVTVNATNVNGTSQESTATAPLLVTTVPQSPRTVTATSTTTGPGHSTDGNQTTTPGQRGQDIVSWGHPADGGKAISKYVITSSDTAVQPGGLASPYEVNYPATSLGIRETMAAPKFIQ